MYHLLIQRDKLAQQPSPNPNANFRSHSFLSGSSFDLYVICQSIIILRDKSFRGVACFKVRLDDNQEIVRKYKHTGSS